MTTALVRSVVLPRPAHGNAERVQLGRAEIVLENRRGSYTLLWSNGRESKRYVLGLTDAGHLTLELCAPRYAMECVPRDAMTLVPGARIRGYVTVPLVPTVTWRTRPDSPERLLELLPADLDGLWTQDGGHVFRVSVPWVTRFPFAGADPHCVVPLRLRNSGPEAVSPGKFDLRIADDELIEMRGTMLVRPRRIELGAPPSEARGAS